MRYLLTLGKRNQQVTRLTKSYCTHCSPPVRHECRRTDNVHVIRKSTETESEWPIVNTYCDGGLVMVNEIREEKTDMIMIDEL